MATYVVRSKGKSYTVEVVDQAGGGATVSVEEESFQVEFVSGDGNAASAMPAPVSVPAAGPVVSTSAPAVSPQAPVVQPTHTGSGSITAPIPGKVLAVHFAVGATVAAGETVITLEAMKMENAIATPIGGTVREIAVSEGSEVATGQLLMAIE